MKPPMNQTCQIVSWTRNIYGDLVNAGTTSTTINCKFRQIIDLQNNDTNREENTSSAMLWTDPDVDISIGSIILFDSIYYRVAQLLEARKIDSSDIQFLKCRVERLKDVANVS